MPQLAAHALKIAKSDEVAEEVEASHTLMMKESEASQTLKMKGSEASQTLRMKGSEEALASHVREQEHTSQALKMQGQERALHASGPAGTPSQSAHRHCQTPGQNAPCTTHVAYVCSSQSSQQPLNAIKLDMSSTP